MGVGGRKSGSNLKKEEKRKWKLAYSTPGRIRGVQEKWGNGRTSLLGGGLKRGEKKESAYEGKEGAICQVGSVLGILGGEKGGRIFRQQRGKMGGRSWGK